MKLFLILLLFLIGAVSNIFRLPVNETTLFRRIYGGENEHVKLMYPFVVVIARRTGTDYRRACTASLISREFVLTAAHCLQRKPDVYRIYYGNLSNFPNNNEFKKVIKIIPHYGFKEMMQTFFTFRTRSQNVGFISPTRNDIGLAKTEKLMLALGKISVVDFKSLLGRPALYIGGGNSDLSLPPETAKEKLLRNTEDTTRPLLLGHAVIAKCDSQAYYDNKEDRSFLGNVYVRTDRAVICLKPKCSRRMQMVRRGDSGGPLIFNGKIIGVCSTTTSYFMPNFHYTAVSPYIDWIQKMIITHS